MRAGQKFAIGLMCALAVTALGFGPSSAAPVTLSCVFTTSNSPNHPFAQADQFVYDLEASSAELRVARSMGTDVPVNWIFVTRRSPLDDDSFAVRRTTQGVVGAGIHGSAPHSFALSDTGLLVWSFIWFTEEPTWLVWQCQR